MVLCRKNTESKKQQVARTKNWKNNALSNVQCVMVKNKISKRTKAKGLLSSLGIQIPLSKILL